MYQSDRSVAGPIFFKHCPDRMIPVVWFTCSFAAYVCKIITLHVTFYFSSEKKSDVSKRSVGSSSKLVELVRERRIFSEHFQWCNKSCYYMAVSHKDWELPNSRI